MVAVLAAEVSTVVVASAAIADQINLGMAKSGARKRPVFFVPGQQERSFSGGGKASTSLPSSGQAG